MADLLSQMDIVTFEKSIQTDLVTVAKDTGTELTLEQLTQQEQESLQAKRQVIEIKKEKQQLENTIKLLEDELKKKQLTGVNSNPESARRLSPKYKTRVEAAQGKGYIK